MRDNLAELIHSRTTVEAALSIFVSICSRLSVREIKIVLTILKITLSYFYFCDSELTMGLFLLVHSWKIKNI